MREKAVYLDNSATTMVLPEVAAAMGKTLTQEYGNASSMHSSGRDAFDILEQARKFIADSIGALPEEIYFTGSATEANNIALIGASRRAREINHDKNHIIVSKIEHPSVLNTAKALEKEGFSVTYLSVDKDGFVSPEALRKAITKKTILASIIHANHEIGTIQDIKALSQACREKKVLFHTDAAQSYTKNFLNVKAQGLDMVSLNAHKIHGPKGVGALYIRRGIPVAQITFGGPQEGKLRPGTENIPGIAGFYEAAEIALRDYDKNRKQMRKLRDYLTGKLLAIKGTLLNGPRGEKRNCNNINISFLGIEGEAIMMRLDAVGINVSTGSACSSQSLEPSHVLLAIGRSHGQAHGSLRITISKFTTKKELDYAYKKIVATVKSLRKLSQISYQSMEMEK
jgi:cysteine desulfurase